MQIVDLRRLLSFLGRCQQHIQGSPNVTSAVSQRAYWTGYAL